MRVNLHPPSWLRLRTALIQWFLRDPASLASANKPTDFLILSVGFTLNDTLVAIAALVAAIAVFCDAALAGGNQISARRLLHSDRRISRTLQQANHEANATTPFS